jgi:ArsR family transcriptional regulator
MVDDFLADAAEMLRVMGHPVRLLIAQLLEEREHRVGELVEALGLSQSTCSQHLRAMRLKGLVRQRRAGNAVYYSIGRPEMHNILHCLRDRQQQGAGAPEGRATQGGGRAARKGF